jgi:hypothetical protein
MFAYGVRAVKSLLALISILRAIATELRNVALHGAIAYRCATDAFELARNAHHMYQRSDRGEINILGGKTAICVSQRIQG